MSSRLYWPATGNATPSFLFSEGEEAWAAAWQSGGVAQVQRRTITPWVTVNPDGSEERERLRPWSYREPANDVTLHVNSQGSDGIAFVAVPKWEGAEDHMQYGVVVPRDAARELARAILAELGEE